MAEENIMDYVMIAAADSQIAPDVQEERRVQRGPRVLRVLVGCQLKRCF